jgi:hypothetical protein
VPDQSAMKPIVSLALALCAAPLLACEARSGADAPVVVELYTSEGCNSCPPADRWLSTLKGRDGVLALAFHVDYWDNLGWPDRFASPAHTQRQYARRAAAGARFVYTPQVLADGADWRRWPALPAPRPSTVALALVRDASGVQAQVAPLAGAPRTLTGYWALLEDGHSSAVQAGENAGVTLHHDHVVRAYRPLAPWSGARTLRWDGAPPAGAMRRIALVVEDGATGRPLQALALGC